MQSNSILILMTVLAEIFGKTSSGTGECIKEGTHVWQIGNLNRHNLSVGLSGQLLRNSVYHLTQQFYCQTFTLRNK